MYNNEKFEEMTSYIKNREVKTKLSHRNEDPQWFEGKLIHNIKVITVIEFSIQVLKIYKNNILQKILGMPKLARVKK